jgi:hypothetical protein
LTNVGSLDERAIESKLLIVERDFIMKNSFNEWSPEMNKREINQMLTNIPIF